MAWHNTLDPYELAGWGKDEKHSALLASPVHVDAVVGLLFTDVFERFVLAAGHAEGRFPNRIYAFAFGTVFEGTRR